MTQMLTRDLFAICNLFVDIHILKWQLKHFMRKLGLNENFEVRQSAKNATHLPIISVMVHIGDNL